MMLFSLIVPAYNIENYIEKCLDSLEGQTFRDFEVILVDDGSSDSTRTIVEHFITGKETQYRLISQKNRGLSSARNTALKYAIGQYIVFVDGDDWIEPDYLSFMKTIIQRCSPDIIRCSWFENRETEMLVCDLDGDNRFLNYNAFMQELLIDHYGSQVWKNVYRASLWRGVSFPEGALYEDLYTTHRIFAKAKSVFFCKQAFYHYMIRTGSISTAKKFGRAKGIYYGFKYRYEWVCRYSEYKSVQRMLLVKLGKQLNQYLHECAYFKRDSEQVVEECRQFWVTARQEHITLTFAQKVELYLSIYANSLYWWIFRFIRGKV